MDILETGKNISGREILINSLIKDNLKILEAYSSYEPAIFDLNV